MADYYAKALQLRREYENNARRKCPPSYAFLEVLVELENALREKVDLGVWAADLEKQRELLMRNFFLELLLANGYHLDNGRWIPPEEAKKEPKAR